MDDWFPIYGEKQMAKNQEGSTEEEVIRTSLRQEGKPKTKFSVDDRQREPGERFTPEEIEAGIEETAGDGRWTDYVDNDSERRPKALDFDPDKPRSRSRKTAHFRDI